MILALEFGSNPVAIPESSIINFPSKTLQAQNCQVVTLQGLLPAGSNKPPVTIPV